MEERYDEDRVILEEEVCDVRSREARTNETLRQACQTQPGLTFVSIAIRNTVSRRGRVASASTGSTKPVLTLAVVYTTGPAPLRQRAQP